MPSRTRSRKPTQAKFWVESNGVAGTPSTWVWNREEFSDFVPGPCSCYHVKHESGWSGRSRKLGTSTYNNWENLSPVLGDISTPVSQAISSLNWDKLPSSTESGIIQILAEIDDTIAIFTQKFWRQLSYGSFTWGLVPFVSDLTAIARAVQNLSLDLKSFTYEDSLTVPIDNKTVVGSDVWECSGVAVVHKTGFGNLSFQNPGNLALDWLGFHPDLATAWDLVPLSFIVDYLLPIGDFLESFRQGGWVKVMAFGGWITIKYDLSTIHYVDNPLFSRGESNSVKTRVFTRKWSNDVLVVQPDHSLPQFETPSLREMFNMLYVLTRR